jgi:hypothetical protein
MPTTFRYDRLAAQERKIRLLMLHKDGRPGSRRVECRIETIDQTQSPPYIAVSYRWGDANQVENILLNGHTFEVPKSIWQFLMVLRDSQPGPIDWLWIDSICINQQATLEKSLQVAKMGEIYARAKEVWVWLGQPVTKTKSAIDFITNEELREPTIEQSEGLEQLFNRSFWKRIWIVQEIMLAPELRVFCGDVSFPWHALSSAAYRLQVRADTTEYAAALMRTHAIRIIQAKHTGQFKNQEEKLGYLCYDYYRYTANSKHRTRETRSTAF